MTGGDTVAGLGGTQPTGGTWSILQYVVFTVGTGRTWSTLQNVTVTFGFGVTYSMLQCDGITGGTQSAVQLGVTDVDTRNDIGVDTVVDSLDVQPMLQ